MKKYFLIAFSNIRKSKGQTVTITVLIMLASMMFNMWFMLSFDYRSNFDRNHDRLNAEHVMALVHTGDEGFRSLIAEKLDSDMRTDSFCMDDALGMGVTFNYNGGKVGFDGFVMRKGKAENREIGKVEILEEIPGSGIYLPMLYGTENNYRTGDEITMTMSSNEVTYTVRGFFNSVMAGSHNCSMAVFLLTDDLYDLLAQKPFAYPSTLISVRIRDKGESNSYEAGLKNIISANYPDIFVISNTYALVAQSRYISQSICSGIISAMAFFVTIIALVVIASNVINYIQENMKSLGALKAVGYTGGQLICVLLVQFLGITFITSALGVMLSYSVFPAVNIMMTSQTGIPYRIHFLPVPCIAAMMPVCLSVAFTVWLSARRIKKIEPIVALRQGINTHNFKRNHIPLDKTCLPVSLALALKTTFSGLKQNITICVTMLGLSLIIVFSGMMWRNMMVDIRPFVDLIAGEYADSCIDINVDREAEFLDELKNDSRVEMVYLYTQTEVIHVGNIALTANLSDDFTKVNNPNVVFKGRYPKYDNEIAIAAKYAKDTGLKIGNEITLIAEGNEASYIITGFTQLSNYLGRDCLMTRGGYERMGKLQHLNWYVNLTENTDIDAFNAEQVKKFGSGINATINILSVLDGTSQVYVLMVTVIVIAILILSVLIIAFVLYLLVRTMLNNKKRDYGIQKALGFTTGQLIAQTALSFMPSLILSAAVGLIVSAAVINPLTALFLSNIGIVKCTFIIPAGFIALAGLALILLAFATACLLSLKIRKIAPRELLTGE